MGNIVNRVFDSSGPEGKVRGTPQQIIDKYNQLARDAQLSNDRVAFENFQQHAEHYTRMLGEAMREQEQFRQQNEGGRPGDDRDFQQPRDQQPRDQQPREQQPRDQRPDDRGDRQDRGERFDRDRSDRNDRDRTDRDDRDRNEDRFDPPRFLQARADDVIDVAEDEDRGGLVETPEAAAAAPSGDDTPRPPRRRRRKGGSEGGEGQPDVKPEAAE
jgi:Domain of unknown function (DUF4167)